MLRRTIVVLGAALLAVPTMLTGAAAGGMSSFDFDRQYYVAGDQAVGETVFWISRKDLHLLDRTFYAYLIPEQTWIEPPNIPRPAVLLGPVSLDGIARISFTVPDVSPGAYTIGICDRPCRRSYVGDLGGGWISVVESHEEARLLPIIDRLRARVQRVQWEAAQRARRHKGRIVELRRWIEGLDESVGQAREELGARLVAVEARPQAERGSGAFDRAGWAVAALAIAALAFVYTRRRGRPELGEAPPPQAPAATDGQELEWKIEGAELEEREPVGVG